MSGARSLPALLLGLLLSGCAALARPAPAPAPSGAAVALDSLFRDTTLAHAQLGVVVRSLAGGATLYQQNATKLFVPASNMKLLTGAAALEALGPDYRYVTEVATVGPVRNGVLQGALVVRGSGDPTLSNRYQADPRQTFRAWADSLRARGITRIAGPIVGVDSAFAGPGLGAGWEWDDLDWYYAAPVSGLQFNENDIRVQLFPSRTVGQPPVVLLDPPTQYVTVVNRATTTAPGTPNRIRLGREASGPGIVVEGTIGADAQAGTDSLAVRNPTLYFVSVLRETLREAGVQVEGQALDAGEWEAGELPTAGAQRLFVHSSPPLRDILPGMLKPSQNQIAETLLRTLGRVLKGEGSAAAGAAAEDSIFASWGLDTRHLRIADGSGLSTKDLVSPDFLVGVLAHMRRSPHAQVWLAALPVAGEEGTLAARMRGTPAAGRVRAKTGSLTGVRSLSGYLTRADGEELVFSILVDNHVLPAAEVDRLVDAALARLAGS